MPLSCRPPQAPLQTPCIDICVILPSGLCAGCARTPQEIAAWLSLSTFDRRAIMEQLPARKAALTSYSPL